MSNSEQTQENDIYECPFCAERIKIKAKICRFCNRELLPASQIIAPSEPTPSMQAPVPSTVSSVPKVLNQAYFLQRYARSIEEADQILKEAEEALGKDDQAVAKILLQYAQLLREKKVRTLDAANMEARAKAIYAKGSSPHPQQVPAQDQQSLPSSISTSHPIQNTNEYKKCPFCAEAIKSQAIKCKSCGSDLAQNSQIANSKVPGRVINNQSPDPVLMAVLSGCCLAGLGQMLCGQVAKGIVILAGSLTIGAVTGGLGALIVLPLGAYDAYLIANRLREGRNVGAWDWGTP